MVSSVEGTSSPDPEILYILNFLTACDILGLLPLFSIFRLELHWTNPHLSSTELLLIGAIVAVKVQSVLNVYGEYQVKKEGI